MGNTADTMVQLDRFLAQRKEIERALRIVKGVAEQAGVGTISNDIDRTIGLLSDTQFRLVVVGEFSRGKSTVVNALLGDRVLPSTAQPTTVILNVIRYADQPSYTLHYRNGGLDESISKDRFLKMVAPPEPLPGDKASESAYVKELEALSKVEYAEIRYPSPLCRNAVSIVDTPGTNDLDPVRESITYNFIPESDAVIVVLSAKMILAKTEMDFLRDRIIKADIQRIFFVINFADHLETEADRRKVLDYAKRHLRELVPSPRLYLISARAALNLRRGRDTGMDICTMEETGFPDFESELARFLTEERGHTKLAKPVAHGKRLCHELENGALAMMAATTGMGQSEIQTKIRSLKPEIDGLERKRDSTVHGMVSAFSNLGLQLSEDLRRGLERIADLAVATVDNYNGPMEKDAIAHAIESAVAPRQTELYDDIRKRQEAILRDEAGRAQRRLEDALKSLYSSMDRVLYAGVTHRHSLAVIGDQNDDLVLASGAGGVGIGLLAGALHVAFPIAIIAAALGGFWLHGLLKSYAMISSSPMEQ